MSAHVPAPTRRRRRGPLLGSLVLLLLGVVGLAEAWRFGLWRDTTPGSGLFPAAVSMLLIALCVTAVVIERRDPGGASDAAVNEVGTADSRRLVAYTAALSLYALALEPLGYVIATAAVLVFLLRGAERLTWTRTIVITVTAVIVCEIVFVRLLALSLPSGPFF